MKTLSQIRAAVHEHLSLFLQAGAVDAVEVLIDVLASNPQQRRPLAPPTMRFAPPRLDNFPPTYFRMNEHLSLIEVSPELLTLLELARPEDLLGNAWERYLEPDEFKRLYEKWMVAAQVKGGFSHEFVFTTPSGQVLRLRERVWPMRDTSTLQFHGWFGYVEAVRVVLKMTLPAAGDAKQSA